MTRTRTRLILLVTLLALAFFQTDTMAQSTFEAAACPFEPPPGAVEGEDIECGYVSVPEDHTAPDSRQIKLAVAIIHPPGGPANSDPIVYLSGGPGGSRLMLLNFMAESYPPMFALERDLIIFDQRGVGYSQPALICPEMVELLAELFDYEWQGETLDAEGVRELKVDTLTACRDDLSAIADLSLYNTAQNAADVADLRVAMGYDEINLYGSSYGTRLAL
ncbi:MAG: alpha/beta fold hydrolase, partial [Anaerolineae bacterium]|nr:alpha/beta fold hydrolase [Anaerolineae bacterium]